MRRLDVLLTIHFVYDELPLLYVLMFCTYYTNYSLFFPCFQEPTSGLDASTALSIMQQMKVFATTYNKTIITSIHQPSSQIFHMFNNMLLLINGQVSLYTILTSCFCLCNVYLWYVCNSSRVMWPIEHVFEMYDFFKT